MIGHLTEPLQLVGTLDGTITMIGSLSTTINIVGSIAINKIPYYEVETQTGITVYIG